MIPADAAMKGGVPVDEGGNVGSALTLGGRDESDGR